MLQLVILETRECVGTDVEDSVSPTLLRVRARMETLRGCADRLGFAGQDSEGSGACNKAPSGRLRSRCSLPRSVAEASLSISSCFLLVRARDLIASRSFISTDLQNRILNMGHHTIHDLSDARADSPAVQADSLLQRKLEWKSRSIPQSTPPKADESLYHEVPDAGGRVNEWMLTATELQEVKTAVIEFESRLSVPYHASLI
jgi:hypothetical protein